MGVVRGDWKKQNLCNNVWYDASSNNRLAPAWLGSISTCMFAMSEIESLVLVMTGDDSPVELDDEGYGDMGGSLSASGRGTVFRRGDGEDE